ncbi:MAG: DUF1820 family protein [Reinekea sp.]|jgi:hypothetical protein|nr:DUF1820 family protein [Reinekea sp.]
MNKVKSVYRVKFVNQDKLYEVYCSQIYQSDMFGFLEIEELIFGERSQLLVDPGEERLQKEFSGVKRSYIPMHSIVRIDEVEKEGTPKISDSKGGATVTSFPTAIPTRTSD